jgi:hypothetical protein
MPPKRPSSFKTVADTLLADKSLSPAHREYLTELKNHPVIEDAWRKIRIGVKKTIPTITEAELDEPAIDDFMIRTILGTRSFANDFTARFEHREELIKNAGMAKRLAKFFRNSTGMSYSIGRQLPLLLEEAAEALRKWSDPPNIPGRMRISRKSAERERVAFMSAMSRDFEILCGQPLDDVVCTLTDAAFSDSDRVTTVAQVISARKPSTSKGRSKPR